MCALQFASQLEQKQIDNSIDGTETIDRLNKINNLLLNYLDTKGTDAADGS
jgi:cell division protein ZapA